VLFALLVSSPQVSAALFGVADVVFTLLGGSPELARGGLALFLFWR